MGLAAQLNANCQQIRLAASLDSTVRCSLRPILGAAESGICWVITFSAGGPIVGSTDTSEAVYPHRPFSRSHRRVVASVSLGSRALFGSVGRGLPPPLRVEARAGPATGAASGLPVYPDLWRNYPEGRYQLAARL